MEEKSCIKFYPNINVDFLKIERTITSLNESFSNLDKINSQTVLINNFFNNINAKYFPSSEELTGTTFSVYRKTYYQTYYDYLCTLTNNQIIFNDHNIVNNEYYHYLTYAETTINGKTQYLTFENKDGDGNEVFIHTQWNKFSLCDIIETDDENIYEKSGNVWLFNCNLSEGDLTQNLSVNATTTLGKYDKIYIGKKNYESGKVTCLLGDIKEFSTLKDGSLIEKNTYTEKSILTHYYEKGSQKIEDWKYFCYNGNLKLLKNIAGDSWIIQIIDNPNRNIVLATESPVTTITFSWQEILDKNTISIIEN